VYTSTVYPNEERSVTPGRPPRIGVGVIDPDSRERRMMNRSRSSTRQIEQNRREKRW
jgi:hypothetical protein